MTKNMKKKVKAGLNAKALLNWLQDTPLQKHRSRMESMCVGWVKQPDDPVQGPIRLRTGYIYR